MISDNSLQEKTVQNGIYKCNQHRLKQLEIYHDSPTHLSYKDNKIRDLHSDKI